jgi:hypothetical protein
MFCDYTHDYDEKFELEPKEGDKALFQNEEGEFYLAEYDGQTGEWWSK